MLKFNVWFLPEFFIPDKGYPPFMDNYSAHIDLGQAPDNIWWPPEMVCKLDSHTECQHKTLCVCVCVSALRVIKGVNYFLKSQTKTWKISEIHTYSYHVWFLQFVVSRTFQIFEGSLVREFRMNYTSWKVGLIWKRNKVCRGKTACLSWHNRQFRTTTTKRG